MAFLHQCVLFGLLLAAVAGCVPRTAQVRADSGPHAADIVARACFGLPPYRQYQVKVVAPEALSDADYERLVRWVVDGRHYEDPLVPPDGSPTSVTVVFLDHRRAGSETVLRIYRWEPGAPLRLDAEPADQPAAGGGG